MNSPLSLVMVSRVIPVSVCVARISTPGSTAAVWSLAVPLIWAVAWAHTQEQLITTRNNPLSTPQKMRLIEILLVETRENDARVYCWRQTVTGIQCCQIQKQTWCRKRRMGVRK